MAVNYLQGMVASAGNGKAGFEGSNALLLTVCWLPASQQLQVFAQVPGSAPLLQPLHHYLQLVQVLVLLSYLFLRQDQNSNQQCYNKRPGVLGHAGKW